MKLLRCLGLAIPALLLPVSGSSARQDPLILTIPDDPSCASCTINIEELVRLGDAQGPGRVESESTQLTPGTQGEFYMHTYGNVGRSVHAFDRTGALLTSLVGPREFESIVAVRTSEDGRVFAYDRNRKTAVVFSDEHEFESEIPLDVEPTHALAHLTDQLAVVATTVPTGQRAGLPLHLMNLETGELVRSFGSRIGGAVYPGLSLSRRVARRDADSLWAAPTWAYELELWGVDGRLRLVLKREAPWFPAMPGGSADLPPSPALGSIWAESDSRIWVAILVADPDYDDHITRLEGGQVRVTGTRTELFDTIIEVIDLDAQAVVARSRYDRELYLLGTNLIGGARATSASEFIYVVSQLSLSEEVARDVTSQRLTRTIPMLAGTETGGRSNGTVATATKDSTSHRRATVGSATWQ
jgi:hypothetical protein